MRIIGGEWSGRRLTAPRGSRTRPSSDRVRESLFSALETRDSVRDREVLDLFAGTGALGLESLSRGAESATFVERDPSAARALRDNIRSLGARAVVLKEDAHTVVRTGTITGGPFSLLFLDPPYRIGPVQVRALLDDLARGDSLAEGAVVVYEHDVRNAPGWPDSFEPDWEREYGDTVVSIAIYREG